MATPFSISDTYQVCGNYLTARGSNTDICTVSLGRYFPIPQQGAYAHFRFYLNPQPGTVRVEWRDLKYMVRVTRIENTEGVPAISHQLLSRTSRALLSHFALAGSKVLYVELCEGPHDKDCNTLPDTVQYPHIGDLSKFDFFKMRGTIQHRKGTQRTKAKGTPMTQNTRVRGVNTTIATQDGWTVVTYHTTPVVKFNSSTIILDTGGWKTATTKLRMNQTANQFDLRFHVYQHQHLWYVEFDGEQIPFPYTGTLTLTR